MPSIQECNIVKEYLYINTGKCFTTSASALNGYLIHQSPHDEWTDSDNSKHCKDDVKNQQRSDNINRLEAHRDSRCA
jgi:hypothetical protein